MDPTQADAQLVQRCQEGDRVARRALLLQVLPTMRGATRSLLPQVADADDALQQATIDLLAGLSTYRGQGRVEAWARTIAVRCSLRLLAKNRRHISLADPDRRLRDETAEHDAIAERLPRSVRSYLENLPAVQREVLVLRHGLGYTVPEISELCGESVNTIKSRLVTARKRIRKLIRQDENIGTIVRDRTQP